VDPVCRISLSDLLHHPWFSVSVSVSCYVSASHCLSNDSVVIDVVVSQ